MVTYLLKGYGIDRVSFSCSFALNRKRGFLSAKPGVAEEG